MENTYNFDRRAISDGEIDENLEESFPASDPPSWTSGTNHGVERNENEARSNAAFKAGSLFVEQTSQRN